jgi:hypothetical protein
MLISLDNLCNLPAERLPFSLFGLCLQEPMALVTNWIIAITAFILYFRIKDPVTAFQQSWRKFYFYFGLSTFFSGFGHVLFNYFDVYGKYPTWILGLIAAYHAGRAMISLNVISPNAQKMYSWVLYAKLTSFALLALILQSFIFVMVDAVITYLFFCLGFGIYYWRKGINSFKYTVIAVLILFPSIFIFTLKINPHIWFNKDDLSHVLMALTIIFFYLGVSRLNEIELKRIVSLKELEYVEKQPD